MPALALGAVAADCVHVAPEIGILPRLRREDASPAVEFAMLTIWSNLLVPRLYRLTTFTQTSLGLYSWLRSVLSQPHVSLRRCPPLCSAEDSSTPPKAQI